jgi:putative DNA primase/helicase
VSDVPLIEITSLTKTGGPLTKRISLTKDGFLKSDGSACVMSEGRARRTTFSDLRAFAAHIGDLASHEAIALGALRDGLPGTVNITTARKLEELNGSAARDLISRTAGQIEYRSGATSLALIDVDTKAMPAAVWERIESLGGFWRALVSILPELEKAGHVTRRSTSAGIVHGGTGEALPGSNGLHIFVVVADGGDVERFLKAFHARCWLRGLGWLMVGASGQLLERSLIDRMVYAPERLVFEGAPVLGKPLTQDKASRAPVIVEGPPLDTAATCPDLTESDRAKVKEIFAQDRQRIKPEAERVRAGYITAQATVLVKRTGCSLESARRTIERRIEGVLLPGDVLPFDSPEFQGVTVAEVLADPDRYVGATLADPQEGPDYGRGKAKVMRRADGGLWIHSFAHGRATYELSPPPVLKANDGTTNEAASPAVNSPLVLSAGAPLISAREMIARHYIQDTTRTLHHQQSIFFEWCGTHYRATEREEVRSQVYRFLDGACRVVDDRRVPFNPTRSKVADVVDALAALAQIPGTTRAPSWLDNGTNPTATDILACVNGLLHLPSRTLVAHTPNFFGVNAVEYGYEPSVGDPIEWLAFLASIWSDDPDTIATLQELFGLLLTGDTTHQKLFLIVGPKRSGKGTIARILTALLGRENVAGPTLSSLSQNFGLAALIGKPLAVISDARLGGRTDPQVIAERLLAISGEDSLSVDRKFLDAWTGRLPTRFLILTNELPSLADASGALASRFIVLRMTRSFYGVEDAALTGKLLAELPAILNWAMVGRDRIAERGHFKQPASAKQAVEELSDLGSPIGVFIRDRCEVRDGLSVVCDELFDAWTAWCAEQHRDHAGTKQLFGRNLRAFVPGLDTDQVRHAVTSKRIRFYKGVALQA